MNFLKSAILMALLSLVTVFAGPPPAQFFNDDVFEYMVVGKFAYIQGITNKNVKELVVKPYASYKGQKYQVITFDCQLQGTKVEKFVVPSEFNTVLTLNHDVFANVKTLKTIQIDGTEVDAQYNTFDNMNQNVKFKGKGVNHMMSSFAKSVLFDKYRSSFEVTIN